MQCKCGGLTGAARYVTGNARLEFERCRACKREFKYMLLINGKYTEHVAIAARVEFMRLLHGNR